LKMSGYQWDLKAPMPSGALLSAGWKLIQPIIGDGLVHLQKQKWFLIGCRSQPGSRSLLELADLVRSPQG
jgi:hypothetical protein